MTEKELGLVAGIIAVAGIGYYFLTRKEEDTFQDVVDKNLGKIDDAIKKGGDIANDIVDAQDIITENIDKITTNLGRIDVAKELVGTTQEKITGALDQLADMKSITERMLASRENVGTLTGLQDTLDILKDATGMDVDMNQALANLKEGMDPMTALESAASTISTGIQDTYINVKEGLIRL